jgi:hypothetical protein
MAEFVEVQPTGISRSQVSRLCAEIDEKVKAFLSRPIEGDWPYLWIDATYVKARQSGRIVPVRSLWRSASTATDGAKHFMRNVPAYAGRQGRRVVAAFIGTAFVQDDAEEQGRNGGRSPISASESAEARSAHGRGRRAFLHELRERPSGEDPLDQSVQSRVPIADLSFAHCL